MSYGTLWSLALSSIDSYEVCEYSKSLIVCFRYVVNRRKRKLQELYQVTCATVGALVNLSPKHNHDKPSKHSYSEADFVEANEVAK